MSTEQLFQVFGGVENTNSPIFASFSNDNLVYWCLWDFYIGGYDNVDGNEPNNLPDDISTFTGNTTTYPWVMAGEAPNIDLKVIQEISLFALLYNNFDYS